MPVIKEKLEEQLSFLRQAINTNKDVMDQLIKYDKDQSEKCSKLKVECQQLHTRIVELGSKKCGSCEALQQKLMEQRRLNRSANSRLKSIASLLCPDDGGQTSTLTNAQWSKMTQILEDSQRVDQDKKRKFTVLTADEEENLQTDKKLNSKIIVPETMLSCETQQQAPVGIIVPETQISLENINDSQVGSEDDDNFNSNLIGSLVPQDNTFLENVEGKVKRLRAERLTRSPVGKRVLTRSEKLKNTPSTSTSCNEIEKKSAVPEMSVADPKKLGNNQKECFNLSGKKTSSQSIISEDIQIRESSKPFKKELSFDISIKKDKSVSLRNSDSKENVYTRKESYWKLKPSSLIKTDNSGKQDGRSKSKNKLKQTTLCVGVVKQKQDISTLETFNGGVANSYKEDDDSDVIFDSPKSKGKKTKVSNRKQFKLGLKNLDEALSQPLATSTCLAEVQATSNSAELTLKLETKDLDETLFHPPVTSTCIPSLHGNSSYDRLPEPPKSPNYKYKRAAVRKKEERSKLPGWSCDECAKYYETAGQSWSKEEIQQRMNACSRHRDKYQIRAKTPPGFWDPVIPPS